MIANRMVLYKCDTNGVTVLRLRAAKHGEILEKPTDLRTGGNPTSSYYPWIFPTSVRTSGSVVILIYIRPV